MSTRLQSVLMAGLLSTLGQSARSADFSRDILPLLSDACFQCHGPDRNTRRGDLRLDEEQDVKRSRKDGAVVVPGQPEASSLIQRIRSQDPDEVMPPPEMNRQLTPAQVQLLEEWIGEGAPWGAHWSLTPVKRPAVPDGAGHPVDHFIDQRLKREGLKASPEADRQTLARRLFLDFTGLPPAPTVVESFLADRSPDAWEKLVDQALNSPAYGERMAWDWLDAARYADSNGYQGDRERTMWPWRDWVVQAFNSNLPWDDFTVWQLAGDLLPGATEEQVLATGFCRNHMINGEGGRIAAENRVDYVMDMTETMGTVWLGLTLNCARCHDHKYDPISQKNYYELYAFFNHTPVTGGGGDPQTPPVLRVPDREAQLRLAGIDHEIASLQSARTARQAKLQPERKAWEQRVLDGKTRQDWTVMKPHEARSEKQKLTVQADGSVLVSGKASDQDVYTISFTNQLSGVRAIRLEALQHPSLFEDGLSRAGSGNFVLTSFEVQVLSGTGEPARPLSLASARATFEQGGLKAEGALDPAPGKGWGVWPGHVVREPAAAVFYFREPWIQEGPTIWQVTLRHEHSAKGHIIGRPRLSLSTLEQPPVEVTPSDWIAALNTPADRRTPAQRSQLDRAFAATDPELSKLQDQEKALEEERKKLLDKQPKVMVMAEARERRESTVLIRGLYNQPGAPVDTAFPAALLANASLQGTNRLDLARWLVSREHPLTSRVTVNRFWQMLFGTGIVKTPEDFGVQGEYPVHPELLDWLAAELMESGWDVKHLLRRIATSETYRRSSVTTSEQLQRDPANRWLARGARFRLPAWMLRDQALFISGLLAGHLGGPPVNGYQPEGIWEEATFGKKTYQRDQGEALYRRSLYTFWRRIVGPTLFFDNAARQVCTVKVQRTNTPLHALTTLNDVTYAEAARVLASDLLARSGQRDPSSLIRAAVMRVLYREPSPTELGIWTQGWERAYQHYQSHPEEAEQFLSNGETAKPKSSDPAREAALGVVCLSLLNTDEALNRE